MSRGRKMRVAGVVATLLLAGFLVTVGRLSGRGIEIRGTLSRGDVAAVVRAHGAKCPTAWPFLSASWFPVSFGQHISACLNPIDVIAAPSEGRVIVVYLGYNTFYYDKKGKHRWGYESYALTKGTNGWQ